MTRRLTCSTAVGLVLAALAAPTALADPHAADTHARAEAAQKQDLRSPDTRDAGEGRGTYTAPNVMIVKVREPVPAQAGIDWADVSIGAGGLLGLILLGLGGSLAVVHRRKAHATPGM
jgi:hypothetical protein